MYEVSDRRTEGRYSLEMYRVGHPTCQGYRVQERRRSTTSTSLPTCRYLQCHDHHRQRRLLTSHRKKYTAAGFPISAATDDSPDSYASLQRARHVFSCRNTTSRDNEQATELPVRRVICNMAHESRLRRPMDTFFRSCAAQRARNGQKCARAAAFSCSATSVAISTRTATFALTAWLIVPPWDSQAYRKSLCPG